MAIEKINMQAAPLLWSDVKYSFDTINDNFDELTGQIGLDPDDFVERTSATGSAILPAGTEAEKDVAPVEGYIRFNTTTQEFEGYDGIAWIPFSSSSGGVTERVFNFASAGVHIIDTFDGTAFRSAEYKLQSSTVEGTQRSTVDVLYGGTPETTVLTEYAQLVSHGVVIATYSASADAPGEITITCETIFPNTRIVFKRDTLSA